MRVQTVVLAAPVAQVADGGRTVRPRNVVVEIAPGRGDGAAGAATRPVDGLDVGAHGGRGSVCRRLEPKSGAALGVDEQALPGRLVVEHDLTRVLGGDP